MAAFLIARLPSQPKSLKAVEFMKKNHFPFRVSANSGLMNILITSEDATERLAAAFGLSDGFELGQEEIQIIEGLTGIFQCKDVKVEEDPHGGDQPMENNVKTGPSPVDQMPPTDVHHMDTEAAVNESPTVVFEPREVKEEEPDGDQHTEKSRDTVASEEIRVRSAHDENEAGDGHLGEKKGRVASFSCVDDICLNPPLSPIQQTPSLVLDQLEKELITENTAENEDILKIRFGESEKSLKRKAEGDPLDLSHKRPAMEGVASCFEDVDSRVFQKPLENSVERSILKTGDEDGMEQIFAAEHEKFLQNVRSIASGFRLPFSKTFLRETYLSEYDCCLESETMRFGYGSFDELFATIPEIRPSPGNTFSWVGEQPQLSDMEELRAKFAEVIRQLGDGATLEAIRNRYINRTGEHDTPFAKFGYDGLESFLLAHPFIQRDNARIFRVNTRRTPVDLEDVKKKIVEVLRELGNRAAIGAINNSYQKKYGEAIPFENLGYEELKSFLLKHPMLELVPGRAFRIREKAKGEKNTNGRQDEQLLAERASGDDVTGKEKRCFAAQQKLRQNIRTIASRFLLPFSKQVFRDAYVSKYGNCLESERKRFGYGSFEELIAIIPEIRAEADGTFSWNGGYNAPWKTFESVNSIVKLSNAERRGLDVYAMKTFMCPTYTRSAMIVKILDEESD